MKLLSLFDEFSYLSIFIRLLLSTIAGAMIGWERGAHGKNAGIRTFSLVCLGAALVMVVNEFLFNKYSQGDPARLGAQVISGVGFLGVGTIIVTGKSHVKGLTTAATLWATACIGIAIGSGYVFGGLIAMLMILFIMTALAFISRITDEYASQITCYMEVSPDTDAGKLYKYAESHGYIIRSIEKQKKQTLHEGDVALIVKINLKKRTKHESVVSNMREAVSINYIEELH